MGRGEAERDPLGGYPRGDPELQAPLLRSQLGSTAAAPTPGSVHTPGSKSWRAGEQAGVSPPSEESRWALWSWRGRGQKHGTGNGVGNSDGAGTGRASSDSREGQAVSPSGASSSPASAASPCTSGASNAGDGTVSLHAVASWELDSVKRRQYLWEEAGEQLQLGLPIAGTYVLDFLMQTVSLSFVGHLGTLPLAAAAIASSLINVTGFSFLEGLASAMETICGQAYGADDFLAVGDVAQRVHLILTAFCIPLAFLLSHTEPLLIAIGQDPGVAAAAAQYVVWEIPGLFLFAAFLPLGKFMEVQGATMPLTTISLISFVLHVALNPLCIYTLDLGFVGAPIAYSITNLAQFLLAVAYLALWDSEGLVKRCWRGWSLTVAVQGWGPYLEMAVPSCLMICLEWWFFEVLIFMAGVLPDAQVNLAAMSVSLQLEGVLFMLPLAMSIAASVRVSNELGAGDAPAAKYAALVAVLLATLFGVGLSLLLFLVRDWVPLIFMDPTETQLRERTDSLVPWLIGCETGLTISTVLSGIVRGSGQQNGGSLVNLVAFYFLGLPASYLLAFRPFHLGVVGLWGGIVVSLIFQTATLGLLTAFTNWHLQVDRAEATIEANKFEDVSDEEYAECPREPPSPLHNPRD